MARIFLSHLVPSAASGLFLALAAFTLLAGSALSMFALLAPEVTGEDPLELALAIFGMMTMPAVAVFIFIAGVLGRTSLSRAAIFGSGTLALLLGGLIFGIALAMGTDAGTAVFGAICLYTLPLFFTGGPAAWFWRKAGPELWEAQRKQALERALGVVRGHGKASMAELARELNVSEQELAEWIRAEVAAGHFTGYVNWKTGTLYCQDSAKIIAARSCPGCGARLELSGVGVMTCDYCGAEMFLRGGG